jgi:hypothetical protein
VGAHPDKVTTAAMGAKISFLNMLLFSVNVGGQVRLNHLLFSRIYLDQAQNIDNLALKCQ